MTTPSPSISPPREQENLSTPIASQNLSEEQIRQLINVILRLHTPAQNRGESRGGGHG